MKVADGPRSRRRTIMKKHHLIASAVAVSVIFSTASDAGGLVGGFGGGLGGGLGGALGANMAHMGGAMNGDGSFNATSDSLRHVNRAADRGTRESGKNSAKAADSAKNDTNKAGN